MANSPLQELMVEQLRDLYDAEKQLTKALPKLAKTAGDAELKQGFRDHLEETKGHAQRLEQIFETLGLRAKSKPCEAMKGLVREGQEAIEEDLEPPVKDLALIAAARRVEHYEMAAYDMLVMASQAAKQPEVTQLLQQTLREESATDKRLVTVAKRLLKEGGKPAKNAGPKSGSGKQKGSATDHSSQTATDHDEIQAWAEERGGKPACVSGTGGKGDTGLLRIEFPGAKQANDSNLAEISWDEFFAKFDEQKLALVYQKHTADGNVSSFNKLVSREPAGTKAKRAR